MTYENQIALLRPVSRITIPGKEKSKKSLSTMYPSGSKEAVPHLPPAQGTPLWAVFPATGNTTAFACGFHSLNPTIERAADAGQPMQRFSCRISSRTAVSLSAPAGGQSVRNCGHPSARGLPAVSAKELSYGVGTVAEAWAESALSTPAGETAATT